MAISTARAFYSTSVRDNLLSLLDAHGLQQFVKAATHRATGRSSSVKSLLDLVIGSASSKRIQHVSVQSDHELYIVTWSLVTTNRPRRQVLINRFRNLNPRTAGGGKFATPRFFNLTFERIGIL